MASTNQFVIHFSLRYWNLKINRFLMTSDWLFKDNFVRHFQDSCPVGLYTLLTESSHHNSGLFERLYLYKQKGYKVLAFTILPADKFSISYVKLIVIGWEALSENANNQDGTFLNPMHNQWHGEAHYHMKRDVIVSLWVAWAQRWSRILTFSRENWRVFYISQFSEVKIQA